MTDDEAEHETPAHSENPPQDADGGAIHPVIGIGASAGGIDALRRLFPHVKPDCGMTFIVVQHLDPGHASVLTEIVARATPLPVTHARAGPSSAGTSHS